MTTAKKATDAAAAEPVAQAAPDAIDDIHRIDMNVPAGEDIADAGTSEA